MSANCSSKKTSQIHTLKIFWIHYVSFCSYVFKHIIIIYRCPGPLFDYLTYVDTNSFFFFGKPETQLRLRTIIANFVVVTCVCVCESVSVFAFLPCIPCVSLCKRSAYANATQTMMMKRRWIFLCNVMFILLFIVL